jgi:hypothetical protein
MEIVCGDLPLEGIRPNALQKKEGFRHSREAGLGDCTAEARRTRSKESLIKKFSDLCELGASVVNTSSQKTRNN